MVVIKVEIDICQELYLKKIEQLPGFNKKYSDDLVNGLGQFGQYAGHSMFPLNDCFSVRKLLSFMRNSIRKDKDQFEEDSGIYSVLVFFAG
ncbi:MAG: hypothetical protein FD159_859 [Syntrophaceae bacterium]|nr:MAG: hypothetical protein FD159_859 [Syntrophaceae bacterium]